MWKALATISLLAVAANASAIPIATVGTIDDLLAHASINSGDASEEKWIEDVLHEDISYTKLGSSGGAAWQSVTGGASGDYAFDFGAGGGPLYYLVKVGGGKGTGTIDTHFLFENNSSMRWGFINLSMFGSNVSLTNIGVISHIGATSVPEPGTLSLLGAGLIAGLISRRRRKIGA
jgi:hypothetical protein